MKILVYLPSLEIGGAELTAIDLAAAIRGRGHEVTVAAARSGPLAARLSEVGLPLHLLNVSRVPRPSPRCVRSLSRLVASDQFDIVHAHDAATTLEAFFGTHVAHGLPLVSSLMTMSIPARFPRSIPLIVGTAALEDTTRQSRTGPVYLMEPPVDTDSDSNKAEVDGSAFRREHGLDGSDAAIVIVSRLAAQMKLEGIERSIDAVALLPEDLVARLVIVGDGEAFAPLRTRADVVNTRLGRQAIVLTGAVVDPRPAYAAADIVLGQGSSILRGMAFAKPCIVLGERGFLRPVVPESIDWFLQEGFYGIGEGDRSPEPLSALLLELLAHRDRRATVGRFSRDLVCERYSLRSAADRLEAIYENAAAHRSSPRMLAPEIARTAAWILAFKSKQRIQRARLVSSCTVS